MMSIEAMKQALSTMKLIDEAVPFPVAKHAMSTLRTAIEEAEKREWVGLTDEEIWAEGADNFLDLAFARDIEAKLKEKNT